MRHDIVYLGNQDNGAILSYTPPRQVASAHDAMQQIKRRLRKFQTFESGWDSYCASAVDSSSIAAAIEAVDELASMPNVPAPAVSPNPDGKIELSWDNGWSLDITVEKTGKLHFVFLWAIQGIEEEGVTSNSLDLLPFLMRNQSVIY